MTFFFFYTWLSSIRPSCYITSHDPEPEGWIVVSSTLHYLALLKSQIPSIHPSIHFLPFFWLSPCTSSSSSKGTLSSQVMQSHHVSWICPTVYSCSKLLPFRRSLARMPSRCCLYLRFLLGVFFGCDTKLMAVVESRNADQLLMPQQSVRPPPPLSCH